MGLKNVVKKGLFSGLNVKRWAGVDQIKQNGVIIGRLFTNVFCYRTNKNSVKESFEECMRRFNMTEEDLQKRMKASVKIVTFCLIGAILIFIYMIYLITLHQLLSGFVCLTLTFLLLAYAFREHFNLYQMKQRRLGCSVREWFKSTFARSK